MVPASDGSVLRLPACGADGWYVRWQEVLDDERPAVRNYTARRVGLGDSGWWIEVGFLLHRDAEGTSRGCGAVGHGRDGAPRASGVRRGDSGGRCPQRRPRRCGRGGPFRRTEPAGPI
ncbi:hypothetical protein BHE97_09595 [Aeromicrobium sp. PE09-221]|nr:hypothetical protein BHE97_09595 [Aeromicrobium sp. PE09-221]